MPRRILAQKKRHRVSTKPEGMRYDERKSTALLKSACWKEDKPMKILPCLFSALTAAAASLIACSSCFADTPQTINLTIENHQKLVTVKDGSGKWLFAQVMTSPNVKISTVASGQNSSRVSLEDETGRTLWSEALNTSFSNLTLHGEWQDKAAASCPQIPSDLGLKPSKPGFRIDPYRFRFEIVVGSDDQLVTARIISAQHRFDITPINHGIIFKGDNKTVIILQPPAAPTVAQASTP